MNNELKEAKRIVAEWEPHYECGFAIKKDDPFLKRLHVMRLLADNCKYWREAYTRKYITASNWEHRVLERYHRFVQYKMRKQ